MINLSLGVLARLLYSRPQDLETEPRVIETTGLPRVFWIYLAGAALVAAGFADYPIIAYHLDLASVASGESIAIFYAVAMAVSGTGSLVLGRLLDRFGFSVLVGLMISIRLCLSAR